MQKQDSILKVKKIINDQLVLNFTATDISNRNLQKLQLRLFDKTKR